LIIDLETGTRTQLTTDDTTKSEPVWTPGGSRVTFQAGQNILFAGGFRRSNPEPLWSLNQAFGLLDVHPDGPRFLLEILPSAAPTAGQDAQAEIVFVQHWFEELKRQVSTN
jgi:Tol biopolymer transport system component